MVFTADSVDTFGSDEIVRAFQEARAPDYDALERDARTLLEARGGRSRLRRARQLETRLERLAALTHFPPANQRRATEAVKRVLDHSAGARGGRLGRPRPEGLSRPESG